MKDKIESEMDKHSRALREAYEQIASVATEAALCMNDEPDEWQREHLRRIGVLVGEQHSRLSQRRALKWALKQQETP